MLKPSKMSPKVSGEMPRTYKSKFKNRPRTRGNNPKTLYKKPLGCTKHNNCDTCPFPDCIALVKDFIYVKEEPTDG